MKLFCGVGESQNPPPHASHTPLIGRDEVASANHVAVAITVDFDLMSRGSGGGLHAEYDGLSESDVCHSLTLLLALKLSSLTLFQTAPLLGETEQHVLSNNVAMDNGTKTDDARDKSLDGDVPKGDIVVGAIAGEEARQGTALEHSLTFFEAIKLYPTAVGWSVFFSLGIIMTAFDPQLLGQLFATPKFQKDFGYKFEGSWIISAPWQTGLLMGSPIGQVVGAFFAS